MEIEKLLPCPFCGGEAKGAGACSADLGIPGDIEIYSIDCQSDDCTATLMLDTKAQTIAAWNTRAPADLRSALEAETSAAAWVNSIPGVRPSDQFIAADRRALESMVARALAASAKGCRA